MELTFKFTINKSFLNYAFHPITIPKGQVDYSKLKELREKFDEVEISIPSGEKTKSYIYFGTAGYGDYYQIRLPDLKDHYLQYFNLNETFLIKLSINQNSCSVFIIDPNQKLETREEEQIHAHYEGALKKVKLNRYERNIAARNKCLEYHGYNCSVCGFNFEDVFGKIGRNFIEVHHIVPISKIGENYKVQPIKELIPVCPNCHAMIHRKYPPYSVTELKSIIKKYA